MVVPPADSLTVELSKLRSLLEEYAEIGTDATFGTLDAQLFAEFSNRKEEFNELQERTGLNVVRYFEGEEGENRKFLAVLYVRLVTVRDLAIEVFAESELQTDVQLRVEECVLQLNKLMIYAEADSAAELRDIKKMASIITRADG